jgi:hypothetical protein
MFGASQFMFTGSRARLRPPDIAGALFRPTRRHGRCYDRARRARPFAALSWADSWPSSRGCPSFSNLDHRACPREIHGDPISRAMLQIALGRAIVWATAILIGAA